MKNVLVGSHVVITSGEFAGTRGTVASTARLLGTAVDSGTVYDIQTAAGLLPYRIDQFETEPDTRQQVAEKLARIEALLSQSKVRSVGVNAALVLVRECMEEFQGGETATQSETAGTFEHILFGQVTVAEAIERTFNSRTFNSAAKVPAK